MSLAMKAARVGYRTGMATRGTMGDPGLFGAIGSALGTVGRAVGGVMSTVGGFIPGIGGTVRNIGGIVSRISGGGVQNGASVPVLKQGPGTSTRDYPVPGSYPEMPQPQNPRGLTPREIVQRLGGQSFDPGGIARTAIGPGTVLTDPNPAKCCPPGYRPNKSAYYRRSPQGTVIYHPKGSVCVKSRRRNPLNPRALSRAMSRVAGAEKAIKKVISYERKVTPKGKLRVRRRR